MFSYHHYKRTASAVLLFGADINSTPTLIIPGKGV